MSKRSKMSSKHSKKHFTRHAMKVHRKNGLSGSQTVMRGGIRF